MTTKRDIEKAMPMTVTEMEKVSRMQIVKCQACDISIGLTNGLVFKVGNLLFMRKVTMRCVGCGNYRVWRPRIDRAIAFKQSVC